MEPASRTHLPYFTTGPLGFGRDRQGAAAGAARDSVRVTSAIPVKVAIAADGDEAVRQRYRAELDRPPDPEPPDLAAVRPQGPDRPVRPAHEKLPRSPP